MLNKKHNNLILIGITVLLMLIIGITNYTRKHHRTSALKDRLIVIDTTKVTKIQIQKPLKRAGKEILFEKKSGQWTASQGTVRSAMSPAAVQTLLAALTPLKIERLTSKTKKKWTEYQLSDSLAIKVQIKQGENNHTMYVGKISYVTTNTSPYQRQQPTGLTYVRADEDPKTYTIKGMLGATMNRAFNSWRNPEVIKLDEKTLSQLRFEYMDQEDFVLDKKDTMWTLDNAAIDSLQTAQYLSRIAHQNSSQFADGFRPTATASHRITLQREGQKELILEAYTDSLQQHYYIHCSERPEVYFKSDTAGLFKQLFVDADYFKP